MVPTTSYWVPGPERTLSEVSAVAGTAFAAPADSTSADAAPNRMVFESHGSVPLRWNCPGREKPCGARCSAHYANAMRRRANYRRRMRACAERLCLTLPRHNPAGRELHHDVEQGGLAGPGNATQCAAAAGGRTASRSCGRVSRLAAFRPGWSIGHASPHALSCHSGVRFRCRRTDRVPRDCAGPSRRTPHLRGGRCAVPLRQGAGGCPHCARDAR